MNEVTFAMDQNLGFLVEDQKWQDFFKKYNIKITHYTDMAKLTNDMGKNTIIFSYLPTANFYYFRNDGFYTPIASALFASNMLGHMSSVLIVPKDSNANTLQDLKGKSLGIIHRYCTSSYFAPAILLYRNNYSILNFFSKIEDVGAWELQVDAILSGKVDATTIQEDVWHKYPVNAEKTKIIGRQTDLPSPLVLCAKNANPEMRKDLTNLLLSHNPVVPPGALFKGFIPYQKQLVESFYQEAEKAFSKK